MQHNAAQQPITDDARKALAWPAILLGLGVLALGTLVYLLDRPAEAAPFFSAGTPYIAVRWISTRAHDRE